MVFILRECSFSTSIARSVSTRAKTQRHEEKTNPKEVVELRKLGMETVMNLDLFDSTAPYRRVSRTESARRRGADDVREP
jgi:hypothetical protein